MRGSVSPKRSQNGCDMLSPDEIEALAKRGQTSPGNIAREYVQHIFLSCLYSLPDADKLFFKGGTALRVIYKSPRFSEDLDFTGASSFYRTKAVVESAARKVEQEIERLNLLESKETTGGYFGILGGSIGPLPVEVQIQVSFRQGLRYKPEPILVTPSTAVPYSVLTLPENILVQEKVEALLTRGKPRDFFDLYFILRKPMGERKYLASKRPAILEKLKTISTKLLYQDLKAFLPRSQWVLAKQLPRLLIQELDRL